MPQRFLSFKKVIDIKGDLLIAEHSLVKHNGLQSKFNENILNKIIAPIREAKYAFIREKNQPDFKIDDSKLWEIIFPSENTANRLKIKRSVLGTDSEVIDDAFNEKIENMFEDIYSDLMANLAIN